MGEAGAVTLDGRGCVGLPPYERCRLGLARTFQLVRPFREHHVDEKAITRHDFIETNGNNCLISLPVALMALSIPLGPGEWQWLRQFVAVSLGAMIFWVMATNQFHKWSHMDSPPALIGFLQRVHLILPPDHHRLSRFTRGLVTDVTQPSGSVGGR